MANRWLILWVLFFARTMMAFQYQSVAALSPFIADSYAASLTDIGLLIGLYLGPGVVVAIPGGSLAARFGDRRVVGWSLVAMLAGGLMMIEGDSWLVLMAGRVLAGIGGVVVNIVMTKMMVDWFTGHKIGTAMGIFISSWPIGIALALLVLPWLAPFGGLMAGWLGMSALVAIALAMFLGIYRPAPGTEDASSAKRSPSAMAGLRPFREAWARNAKAKTTGAQKNRRPISLPTQAIGRPRPRTSGSVVAAESGAIVARA